MNAATLQTSLLARDLAMARSNAAMARSHLDQVRNAATVTGGIDLQPVNLADHHFSEAMRHLDRALGASAAPLVENPVTETPVQ